MVGVVVDDVVLVVVVVVGRVVDVVVVVVEVVVEGVVVVPVVTVSEAVGGTVVVGTERTSKNPNILPGVDSVTGAALSRSIKRAPAVKLVTLNAM